MWQCLHKHTALKGYWRSKGISLAAFKTKEQAAKAMKIGSESPQKYGSTLIVSKQAHPRLGGEETVLGKTWNHTYPLAF